jgi:hypothetical protein
MMINECGAVGGMRISRGNGSTVIKPAPLSDVSTPNPTLPDQRTRVEAGSNTSTVNLRVVRGDEMGLKKGRAIA